jgi:hypothetical protein
MNFGEATGWPTREAHVAEPPTGGILGMRERAVLLGATFRIVGVSPERHNRLDRG